MVTVPGTPPTLERKREVDSFHLASQGLYAGCVGQPGESETPFTPPNHRGVWHDKKRPFQRKNCKDKEKWFTVWREPDRKKNKEGKSMGGKFAKKPALGERAESIYPFKKDWP